MPRLASLYTSLTRNSTLINGEPNIQSNHEDDAAKRQLITHWQNSTITLEHKHKIEDEIIKLFEQSLSLACNNQDTPKVLINLIKINTLKEILNQYAI